MAKDSNQRAESYETDNTGGVLSGLLADEDDFDRRMLWRIGSWGVGAVGAVVLAVMANQSSLGLKREQMAAIDLARQAQQIQLAARETQNETRRLASAIDTLNNDRDRLYTRVTGLEQGLDSVTGTITRQGSTPLAPAAAAADPQAAQIGPPAPVVSPVATVQAATPPKAIANPATLEPNPATVSSIAKDSPKTEAAKTDLAKTNSAKAESARPDIAKTELAKTEVGKPDAIKPETAKADVARDAAKDSTKAEPAKPDAVKLEIAKLEPARDPAIPSAPLVAEKSMMSPPDPAAAKLMEPTKPASAVSASPIPEVVASAPVSDEEADEATAEPKVAVQKTQFGVDLGSANSVSGLRALWRGLLKSRSNAPLTPLRPIIVVKEASNGLGMQLRLVAGPLNDAGAAARICAVLTENKRNCETAIFDGQRLSLQSDDPAATKPAVKPKRGAVKRAAVAEEPPKKPDPPAASASAGSTISSWFGKKGQ